LSEAEACYRRALEISPDFAWAYSNLLFCLIHNPALPAQALFEEHLRFAQQFEAPLRASWAPHGNARDPDRCLQIGFVSPDLRDHAMASFIEPVLVHLAGYAQLSLHGYYTHAASDSVTERLKSYLAHWHAVAGLSNDALAEKIRADGIDILIDLSGHTAENRLLTFARKPAPLQASWMGYPGTTGLQAMDYYFSDRFMHPAGHPIEDRYTEKIVRLPAGAPFLPVADAPAVNALPALENGFLTFGSFNHLTKINPQTIALWSQLLRALPDSHMLIGGMGGEDGSRDRLVEWFAHEGVERERLVFHPRCDILAYLRLHHQVDICLDAIPYGGGTTTYHALWMGVPTLSLAGHTMPERLGLTILSYQGLAEFAADDEAAYVQKGVDWAHKLAALAEVRATLRERMRKSPSGQPALIAAGVERALRSMWQRWCGGLPAQSFEVEASSLDGRLHEVAP
jgi:predicted O-linked N-acetylglucosamine transferase (SPINDLY family)